MPDWDLILTLPNLSPPVPTPFASEDDGIVICSAADDRLHGLGANLGNVTGRQMIAAFRTSQGAAYPPGCLLVTDDAAPAVRNAQSLRAFRNACAVATTTRVVCAAVTSPQGAQWTVTWSDQFSLGYFTPARNGWVQTWTALRVVSMMRFHSRSPAPSSETQLRIVNLAIQLRGIRLRL